MTEWQNDRITEWQRQDKNNMPPDLRSRGHKNPILIRRLKNMNILFCKNCSKGNILQEQISIYIPVQTCKYTLLFKVALNMFSKLTFDLKNQVRAAPSLLFRIHLIPMTLQMLLAKKYSSRIYIHLLYIVYRTINALCYFFVEVNPKVVIIVGKMSFS